MCNCSAPGSPDTSLLITRHAVKNLEPSRQDPPRAEKPVLFNPPLGVVVLHKLGHRLLDMKIEATKAAPSGCRSFFGKGKIDL